MKRPLQHNKTALTKSTIRIKKPPYLGWSHKAVDHVLQNDGLLQALKQHSYYLRQLQAVVSAVLRDLTNMDLPIDVSRYESGLLKLYVPNASTATRLRFLQQNLLTALAATSAFSHLVKIVVRVDPAISPVSSNIPIQHVSSLTCRNPSMNVLDMSNDDQQLRASLQRLARHAPIQHD
jgi:hypothetical protein